MTFKFITAPAATYATVPISFTHCITTGPSCLPRSRANSSSFLSRDEKGSFSGVLQKDRPVKTGVMTVWGQSGWAWIVVEIVQHWSLWTSEPRKPTIFVAVTLFTSWGTWLGILRINILRKLDWVFHYCWKYILFSYYQGFLQYLHFGTFYKHVKAIIIEWCCFVQNRWFSCYHYLDASFLSL